MKIISILGYTISTWAIVVNASSFRTPIRSVSADSRHNLGQARRSTVRGKGDESRTRSRRKDSQVWLDGEVRDGKGGSGGRPIRADWGFLREGCRDGEGDQAVVEIEEDEKVENVALWNWNEITYTTQISIGTPPQLFTMLLSISDTDVFVPSASCFHGCHRRNSYDSSLSSSSSNLDIETAIYQLRMHTLAHLSQDDFEIGGLVIKNQIFGEASGIEEHAPINTWGGVWDGMIGLAPSNFESEVGVLNPFQEMVSRGILDRNVFSIRLPRDDGYGDEGGEILFGDVDESLYIGTLKTLPMAERAEDMPRLKGRWIVPATSISVGSGIVGLDGFVASFETDFPLVALPADYVMLLNRYLGMERGERDEPPSVDCRRRHTMRNLTITLGEHDFVLSPWDYTIEMDRSVWREGKVSKRCASVFYPLPEYIDEKYIVLGSVLMRAFYGVFDLDERTISLAPVKTGRFGNNFHQQKEWQQELRRR